MFCKFCNRLNLPPLHYPHTLYLIMLDDLEESASTSGCRTCSIIWRAVVGTVGAYAVSTLDRLEIRKKEVPSKGPLRVDLLPRWEVTRKVKLQLFIRNGK